MQTTTKQSINLSKSEQSCHHSRPLTGEEYLTSLRDGREVWIYGERVADVTQHPAFHNTARILARLYDALHDPARQGVLTCPTDTGSDGYTHRFFRVAHSVDDLVAARDAIVEWARMTYGWMGRPPDYKGAFATSLGANPSFYSPYEDNARRWYQAIQEKVLYLNHAIADPPVDRHLKTGHIGGIQMRVVRETDAGIVVSGAKTVATNSALTQYTWIGQAGPVKKKEHALNFILPMSTPGVKLLCRPSYQMAARVMGSPFDYPLSSQYDENDSILICDEVLVPWENLFIYGHLGKTATYLPRSGFASSAFFNSCIRLGVKLDFLTGLLFKSLEMTGSLQYRGVQVHVGEVLAYRNLIWSLTEAMMRNPDPWENGAVLPNNEAVLAYRALAPNIYSKIKEIFQDVVASSLIYYNSHATDFQNPELRPYLDTYLRGSQGQDAVERAKLSKLAWDALGTEFGSRHELYERNHNGNHEVIRLNNYRHALASGQAKEFKALVDACLSEYDLNGWTMGDLAHAAPANPFAGNHTNNHNTEKE